MQPQAYSVFTDATVNVKIPGNIGSRINIYLKTLDKYDCFVLGLCRSIYVSKRYWVTSSENGNKNAEENNKLKNYWQV
jgi:hypothetical protein